MRTRGTTRRRRAGCTLAPTTANMLRRVCATRATPRITPIAVTSPKAFQYPSGSARRVALNVSIECVEAIREEPGREPVDRGKGDADERAGRNAPTVAAPKHECDADCDRRVHEQPLDLACRGRHADRPDRRQRDPQSERTHRRCERDSQSTRSGNAAEDDENRRGHEEREGDPAPRLREVRAVSRKRGGYDRCHGRSHDERALRSRDHG